MKKLTRAILIFLMLLQACTNQTGTTYFVDGELGNNTNSGTSPRKAWETLDAVNARELLPGDKVLLKSGCEYTGPLNPQGSGVDGSPIIIDCYGEGVDPVIAGEGKVENTIRLHNQHHWEIRNLLITNTDGGGWDDMGRSIRRAVYVSADDIGDVEHIHLKNHELMR